jgi:hypothetical protein
MNGTHMVGKRASRTEGADRGRLKESNEMTEMAKACASDMSSHRVFVTRLTDIESRLAFS